LLRDILAKFPGDVVRCYLLSTHYRSPIDFSDDKLHAAARSLSRIRNAYGLLQEAAKKPAQAADRLQDRVEQARGEFSEAMDDDFNTALAFSVIFNFCHDLNAALNEGPLSAADAAAAQKLFADFESVLGCLLPQEEAKDDGLAEALMDLILTIRQQARKNKDWATADAIRDKLKELGITIEDTPDGARWKRG
ncbi:MAG: cysteine--tRNA ligase, partial [Firmicutes bacterium]|nr:cysteine--tRNA ligase [Bacillota bacterium]